MNYNFRKEIEESIDLSLEKKIELYTWIYQQNIEFGIPFDNVSPFIRGLKCSQLGNCLYINVKRNVYSCPGCFEKLGDIKESNNSLESIWKGHKGRSKFQQENYICPPRENANIIPKSLYDLITKKIIK